MELNTEIMTTHENPSNPKDVLTIRAPGQCSVARAQLSSALPKAESVGAWS